VDRRTQRIDDFARTLTLPSFLGLGVAMSLLVSGLSGDMVLAASAGLASVIASVLSHDFLTRSKWYRRVVVESRADQACIAAGHAPADVIRVKEMLFRECRKGGRLRWYDVALLKRLARTWGVSADPKAAN
jgi:hypothetical protein